MKAITPELAIDILTPIPAEQWYADNYTHPDKPDCCCVLGHLNIAIGLRPNHMAGSSMALVMGGVNPDTLRQVNDGDQEYHVGGPMRDNQTSIRSRVLNYLKALVATKK